MPEAVPTICPECTKQFMVPPEIVGRKIRCKNCGKVFVAKKAQDPGTGVKKPAEPPKKPEAATIAIKDDDDDEGDGKPYEVTSLDLAPRCPVCANELESEEDKVCLHCGFNLETRTAVVTRRVKDVSGGDIFLWLLPGILAAVGFFLCLTIAVLEIVIRLSAILIILIIYTPTPPLSQMERNFFNCCTIWTVITMLFLMYYQGKFAIKRLILDNKPPEVEL